jgi:hypothetical protein
MYEWRLTPTVSTPLLGDNLSSVHRTRADMIEPAVSTALASAGPGASALDLGWNEGWFSQRLLSWGGHQVVGVDARNDNIRRAELLRDHFGFRPIGLGSDARICSTSTRQNSASSMWCCCLV